MKKPDKYNTILLLVATAFVVSLVFGAVKFIPSVEQGSPKERTLAIVEDGVDFSSSLFTPEENKTFQEDIDKKIQSIKDSQEPGILTIEKLARDASLVRDFQTAIELFEVVDSMGPIDLSFRIEWGRIYLEREEYENARQVFEPMKVSWPVYEAYVGLADAYQGISGTPEYVIDEIYEESLYRHAYKFEVVEEYIEWLEETGRESETLQYYEILNETVPQPLLEERIRELKIKYPEA